MARVIAWAIVVVSSTHPVRAQIHVVTLPPPSDPAGAANVPAQPYLIGPGHYVMPAPYSPNNWSPHIRPFPDYSTLRQPLVSPNRSFGAYALPGGACGSPYLSAPYNGDVESAYNQGHYDAEHEYLWFIASHRAGRLLNQSAAQFDEGIRFFRDGQYEKASVNWLGAADLNHDSAAPRLHAGHALFALGRFAEAVPLLERAFELQPMLAFKTYDIRDEYGDRSEFDEHLEALKRHVARHPSDSGALTLLGYVTYYTQGPSAADSILRRAMKRDPKSYFIPKLLDVSRRVGSASHDRGHHDKKPVRQAPARRTKQPETRGVMQVRAIG